MKPPIDTSRALMGAQPDPPQRSWAARMRRRIGRELVLPFVRLTELGHRFGRFLLRTEYRVGGGCDKRGACCHHILMEWSPWLDRFPWLGRIVLWKLTRFYSFYDKGYTWEVQDGLLVRVLGCHALLPDGRCGEYRLRPLFCRTYPEVPLTGRPMVLSGCGYRFERRDGQPDRGEPSLVHIGALARSRVAGGRISRQMSTAPAKTAAPDPQNSDSPED